MLTAATRYIKLQEEYIKDEQRSLKRELVRAQEEIKRIQSVPLVIGQFMEAIDQKCVGQRKESPACPHANLSPARVSYSHLLDQTMSYASSQPSTVSS
jgi:ATP-dependent 26S proteasome regulatory subunit